VKFVTEFSGIASTLAPQLFQLLPVPRASRCLDPSHLFLGKESGDAPFLHLPCGAAELLASRCQNCWSPEIAGDPTQRMALHALSYLGSCLFLMPSTYEKVMFSNTMKLPKETTYLPNTMDIPDHKVETMIAPLRVCIIGGGPAAMFFCHAWNQQKKSASSSPPPQQQLQELDITCFEMKSTPGGVWRSLTSNVNDHVYDELWTNAAAHNFEFHDYTLHEHFDGKPPTIYLPRRDVNEYLVGRVTKNHCAFFRDYFVFDTQVQLVEEAADDDEGSFLVTVRHLPTGQVSTRVFDRCVWAAGENCLGSIPNSLQEVFRGDTVLGRDRKSDLDKEIKGAEPKEAICLLHSAETHLIREHCRDRKVLLIGGELSAEDMALQCLKWGASHVDVAARGDDWCAVSWTSQWPGDKVKVYLERGVDTVKGSQITLKYVQPIWPCGYMPYQENDDVGEVVLEDIQTVIFCTGYSANLDMLHRSLRPESGVIPQFNMGAHPSLFVTDIDWSTWKMSTHNAAHKITGDVAAGKKRIIRANYNHPDMHRGVFFRNPHMMYLCEHGSDTPLLSLDVHAWLLCSYLTRRVPMPPVEEMKKSNNEQFLDHKCTSLHAA